MRPSRSKKESAHSEDIHSQGLDYRKNLIEKMSETGGFNPTVGHNITNEIPFYKIISESPSSEEDYKIVHSDGRTNRNEDLNQNTNLLEEVKNIVGRIDQSIGNKDDDDEDDIEEDYDYMPAHMNDYEESKDLNEKNESSVKRYELFREFRENVLL